LFEEWVEKCLVPALAEGDVVVMDNLPAHRGPRVEAHKSRRSRSAAAEFTAAQRQNVDRPEAHTTLGSFFVRRGLFADAETEYRAALRLAPQFAPAAVNLADLYRQLGRDVDGESVLRSALARVPNDAGLHYALGLTLIRMKQLDEALPELGRAAGLEPSQARYGYVYAVALHSAGRGEDATKVLQDGLAKHPDNRDILLALMTFSRAAGDIASALAYAEQLVKITPDDRDLVDFVEDLQRQIRRQKAK
jgi:Flp pilus assembly protein TadD